MQQARSHGVVNILQAGRFRACGCLLKNRFRLLCPKFVKSRLLEGQLLCRTCVEVPVAACSNFRGLAQRHADNVEGQSEEESLTCADAMFHFS